MAQAKLALTGTPLDAAYFESRDPAVSLEDELAAFLMCIPSRRLVIASRISSTMSCRSAPLSPGLKNAAIQLRGYNQFYFLSAQRLMLVTAASQSKARVAARTFGQS